MDISILIATANRASLLRDTLDSLARVERPCATELIVIDNRSRDDTARVVADAARHFPFKLRYLYEPEAGKYAALNCGIRTSSGRFIVATDDDVRVERDWLCHAVNGLAQHQCDFVGGRVLPLWGGAKPSWLAERNGLHTKVIAVLDHGPLVREFGRGGISWPLGVNVAYRREAFERVGLFDNRLGRKAGTLRNQAQREWHLRARAAGARGFYVPPMMVHHLVPPERLRKQYFRRWLYWHGISRALLYLHGGFDIEEPELERPPHAGDREIGGVPVHLIRKAARMTRSWVWNAVRGNDATAFEYELWLCFFAGVVRQRWIDRHAAVATGPASSARAVEEASAPARLPVDLAL